VSGAAYNAHCWSAPGRLLLFRARIPERGRIPRYDAVKAELLVLIDERGEGAAPSVEREPAEPGTRDATSRSSPAGRPLTQISPKSRTGW
jgi:hypothetical protein